jgi:DNA repair protein RadC
VFVEERSRPAEAGPVEDRPRERILRRGVETLSDRDLLAVVLGSGSATCDVFTLAARVLSVLDRDNFMSDPEELMRIGGMGPAKATLLAAAMELGRRVVAPRNYRIRQPGDAVPLLQHYADRPQEHFLTVTLNGAHEVTAIRVVSVGLVNRTLVHPREVFADAVPTARQQSSAPTTTLPGTSPPAPMTASSPSLFSRRGRSSESA